MKTGQFFVGFSSFDCSSANAIHLFIPAIITAHGDVVKMGLNSGQSRRWFGSRLLATIKNNKYVHLALYTGMFIYMSHLMPVYYHG